MNNGYVPLFGSLTTGTLCGKWPDIGLWPIVLSLADKNGIVDVTHQYISTVTGLALPEVVACMKRFCEADYGSRSPAEAGARLMLLEEHREWGWQVVNHAMYRERARLMAQNVAQVADGRNAEKVRRYKERKRKTPGDTTGHPETPGDTLSNANANTNKRERARAKRSSRVPEDFSPDLDFARSQCPGIDAAREAQKFRDWEFKTPRSDWPACWRNWIERCRERGEYARLGRTEMGNGLKFAN